MSTKSDQHLANTTSVSSSRRGVLKKLFIHSIGLAMLFGGASLFQPSMIRANVCGEIIQEVGGKRCFVNNASNSQYEACTNDVVGGRCCIGTGAIAACNAPASTAIPTPRSAAECDDVTGCGQWFTSGGVGGSSGCAIDGCSITDWRRYKQCGGGSGSCCVAPSRAERDQLCAELTSQTLCGTLTVMPMAGSFCTVAGGGTWSQYQVCGDTETGARCCVGPEAERQCNTFSSTPYELCAQIQDGLVNSEGQSLKERCEQCHTGEATDGQPGIWTAVGCIPTNAENIVSVIVRLGLGIGGGFALLNILAAGFLLTISQGNPKQTDEAKQRLTAAITGLLFIIVSVVLLHFIGYTVFRIPGFGE